MEEQTWHNLSAEEVLGKLKTNRAGLTTAEAEKRKTEYGPNELAEEKGSTRLAIFLNQLKSPLIVVLIIATIISLVIGHVIDAAVIGAVIILNTIIGFFQEYKAETALKALKTLAGPETKVIRDCKGQGCVEQKIKAREIVPGDIVLLEAGDKSPADTRVLEAANLEIDESMLTGESTPVRKSIEPLPAETQVADRDNMVFSGTIVTQGRGRVVVVSTGIKTEIGKIASLIKETERSETPIQRRTKKLSRNLGIFALLASALVFVIAVSRGLDVFETFLFALATAVSAIPEGLPAVLTITLAVGVSRMAKRNALIRRLQAVDTLGSATVICTDKTGTLTTNQMTVRKIYTDNHTVKVTGEGFNPTGQFEAEGKPIDATQDNTLSRLLEVGALCNDSKLVRKETAKETWEIKGDPTEGALVVAAAKAGLNKEELERAKPRIDEIPFNPQERYMVTFHEENGEVQALVKGAPEAILPLCDKILDGDGVKDLTEQDKKRLLQVSTQLASEALRTLAMAYTSVAKDDVETLKRDFKGEAKLTFVGFAGMIDPPRSEVKSAIELCNRAGIRVIMATGDHKLTAEAIGKELGIDGTARALTGADLEKLNDAQLDKVVSETSVFARVSPTHKYRIVESLRRQGQVVAMTGDGVNDAPALKVADIGIAMGITGTDVTKETADMVLTDDNFASIVNAIEEGRVVFGNIRKVVKYLISTNAGEVIIILAALILLPTVPLIFTAVQILWVNLVTDGLLVIPLALEPKESNVMSYPPRKPNENIINREVVLSIVFVGVFMAVGTLGLFVYGLNSSFARAQSLAFLAIAFFQIFNAFNCRSQRLSFFKVGPLSNRYLLVAVIAAFLLQILAVELSFFQVAFGTTGLSLPDLLLVLLVSSSVFVADEVRKLIQNAISKSAK